MVVLVQKGQAAHEYAKAQKCKAHQEIWTSFPFVFEIIGIFLGLTSHHTLEQL